MATGSFTVGANSYEFEIVSEGNRLHRESRAEVSIRHIPGGDVTYVDVGGNLPERLSWTIYFSTEAAYNNLRGVLGDEGTLTTTIDGTFSAILLSLIRTQRWADGTIEAQAEFLRTA